MIDISSHIDAILTLITLSMAALISPGPDFALIVKNSLIYSRKIALFTALGIACGTVFHTSYILFGIGELLLNNSYAFTIFKYIGAFYLLYIGCKGLMAKNSSIQVENAVHKKDIALSKAWLSGFITCLLNPKAILFLTSMFTVIIKKDTPIFILCLYGGIIFVQTFVWYSIVAVFLSGKTIREKVSSIEHWINRITGSIMILIGIKLLLL